jgi:hypothetical protein
MPSCKAIGWRQRPFVPEIPLPPVAAFTVHFDETVGAVLGSTRASYGECLTPSGQARRHRAAELQAAASSRDTSANSPAT